MEQNQQKSRWPYWILLIVGVFFLLIGLAATGGSLNARGISGQALPAGFDFLFTPIILYLFPCIFISRALLHLHSRLRLPLVAIIGITLFGFTSSFIVDMMKTYNYFVQAEENITQALNNVENAYQKRFNVIKNMDTASRRYQTHERETIKDIAEARKAVAGAKLTDDKVSALDKFDSTVRSLFVNIEAYPNLKADQLVLELMKNITSSEQDLIKEKTEYNNRVIEYNKSVRMMPYAIAAHYYHFTTKELLKKENNTEIYDAQKLLAG